LLSEKTKKPKLEVGY